MPRLGPMQQRMVQRASPRGGIRSLSRGIASGLAASNRIVCWFIGRMGDQRPTTGDGNATTTTTTVTGLASMPRRCSPPVPRPAGPSGKLLERLLNRRVALLLSQQSYSVASCADGGDRCTGRCASRRASDDPGNQTATDEAHGDAQASDRVVV